jgi:hypothetical protein
MGQCRLDLRNRGRDLQKRGNSVDFAASISQKVIVLDCKVVGRLQELLLFSPQPALDGPSRVVGYMEPAGAVKRPRLK